MIFYSVHENVFDEILCDVAIFLDPFSLYPSVDK